MRFGHAALVLELRPALVNVVVSYHVLWNRGALGRPLLWSSEADTRDLIWSSP